MEGFNDFSALKGLKKELEKQEKTSPDITKEQKQRSHTVVHKTKEQHAGEQKARELGLKPGCTVTLMDSNDRGILRHVHKDHVEIELDGLMITAGFRDFIVNNHEEDRELIHRSGTSKKKKDIEQVQAQVGAPTEVTLDLHIERIPGGYDAPKGFELEFQMEYFKRVLREKIKHRGLRINVVHGVGDGVLRDAIRKEIDEVYALRCAWSPGIAGVTIITVK